ncbi:unnamed protein product [Lactuca virosa]|uniref:Small EDRK-rich factor-like N-terminal domain-containing protein n=2 Tax=Lactuca TaxID=4235 RepID=A0AAU9LXW9_9ASTR|nr:unnamed protein product [Lactuca virosa]
MTHILLQFYIIERGNQREKDRERANARGGAKGKNKDDGLTPEQRRERFDIMSMNWAQRKIFLYNVTFGLYMLDPWERYLFNALVIVLMWFIFYNGYRNLNELCKRHLW